MSFVFADLMKDGETGKVFGFRPEEEAADISDDHCGEDQDREKESPMDGREKLHIEAKYNAQDCPTDRTTRIGPGTKHSQCKDADNPSAQQRGNNVPGNHNGF